MIPKIIILLYFVPLCFGCMQTAQRSADAVIQQPTDSADSDVISQNTRMLPNSNVQKSKQNIVAVLSSELIQPDELSADNRAESSSTSIVIETQQNVQRKRAKTQRVLVKNTAKASTSASKKNQLQQTASTTSTASTVTVKTKEEKTVSSSSFVITKSTLPDDDTLEKLLPEDFETEKKQSVIKETEEKAAEEVDKNGTDKKEAEADKAEGTETKITGNEELESGVEELRAVGRKTGLTKSTEKEDLENGVDNSGAAGPETEKSKRTESENLEVDEEDSEAVEPGEEKGIETEKTKKEDLEIDVDDSGATGSEEVLGVKTEKKETKELEVDADGSGAVNTGDGGTDLETTRENELENTTIEAEVGTNAESEETGASKKTSEENIIEKKEEAVMLETEKKPMLKTEEESHMNSSKTVITTQVPEEINLCHTCELPNLRKIVGINNETAQFYEPYIGERTFSANGCAQTLVYCNVPLYLGRWPDNYMEFYPSGPMYRAVRGGGLASEISCSKDGHWKVGSRNIIGVSCVHE